MLQADERGRFGSFGGRYVPEVLMPALLELEEAYAAAKVDPDFQSELAYYLREYVGPPLCTTRSGCRSNWVARRYT